MKTLTIRSYPGERVVLRPDADDPSYPLLIRTGAAYVACGASSSKAHRARTR